jgi:hypothetical protein
VVNPGATDPSQAQDDNHSLDRASYFGNSPLRAEFRKSVALSSPLSCDRQSAGDRACFFANSALSHGNRHSTPERSPASTRKTPTVLVATRRAVSRL